MLSKLSILENRWIGVRHLISGRASLRVKDARVVLQTEQVQFVYVEVPGWLVQKPIGLKWRTNDSRERRSIGRGGFSSLPRVQAFAFLNTSICACADFNGQGLANDSRDDLRFCLGSCDALIKLCDCVIRVIGCDGLVISGG